ncbi:hypothetical protein ACFCP7_27975 [Paenibacillus elgii]
MNYPKELIVKMKEVEFIYDSSIGKVLNGNYVDSKLTSPHSGGRKLRNARLLVFSMIDVLVIVLWIIERLPQLVFIKHRT